MIEVKISQAGNNKVAFIKITGGNDEFWADLNKFKQAIPESDRRFKDDVEPKRWIVENPEKYFRMLPEIGDALLLYNRQLRFDLGVQREE